jgi:hypothetical protein
MKKLVFAIAAVAAVTTTVASAAFLITKDKEIQLERAARLQNLSVIAVEHKDYDLACKAQIEVADAVARAGVKAKDLRGLVNNSKQELCRKATVIVAKK